MPNKTKKMQAQALSGYIRRLLHSPIRLQTLILWALDGHSKHQGTHFRQRLHEVRRKAKLDNHTFLVGSSHVQKRDTARFRRTSQRPKPANTYSHMRAPGSHPCEIAGFMVVIFRIERVGSGGLRLSTSATALQIRF